MTHINIICNTFRMASVSKCELIIQKYNIKCDIMTWDYRVSKGPTHDMLMTVNEMDSLVLAGM